MQIIIHRVNTIEKLRKVPIQFGVEIDVRGYGNQLLLSHDPIDKTQKYDSLERYLEYFKHSSIVFNIKEAGYEQRVIDLAEKFDINDYFLLDVEFSYLYYATRKLGFRKIAVRYSEAEPIEMVLAQVDKNGNPLLDWVWIDTNTMLPIDGKVMKKLHGFKTCLVCPGRWGRPEDILKYKKYLKDNLIEVDAVMTSLKGVYSWKD